MYENNRPTCKCGCNKNTDYHNFKFCAYLSYHWCKPKRDESVLIECKICGYKTHRLINKHFKLHNLTKESYTKLYPNAKIISKFYSNKLSGELNSFKQFAKFRTGKTLEEIHGTEIANRIKCINSKKAREQRLREIYENGISISIGKNETKLLNEQEQKDNCKIIRQHRIKDLGYIVDGYCKETNTVYEVYENYHKKSKVIKRDFKRQEEIQILLKCKFIVIWDIEQHNNINLINEEKLGEAKCLSVN